MINKIQIKIEGLLEKQWETNFMGMKIKYEGNNTVLIGIVKDEAHKFGILNTIRDFNLKLISIEPVIQNDNNKS